MKSPFAQDPIPRFTRNGREYENCIPSEPLLRVDSVREGGNNFLLTRTDKKLQYWTSKKLNSVGRLVICNGVPTLAAMFFLTMWGGSRIGITKFKAKIRNYLWVGEDQPCRAKVAWATCCLRKRDGGLGLVDPGDAMVALMNKWVIMALEPRESTLKNHMRHKLALYQPYIGGNWAPSLSWFILNNHASKASSKVWEQMTRAWKQLVREAQLLPLASHEAALSIVTL
jgi:hypothetical protein